MSSTDKSPAANKSGLLAVILGLLAALGVSLVLLFLIGFISALLKNQGAMGQSATEGLRFTLAGIVAVATIGTLATVLKRSKVPAWVPPIAAMSAGFAVLEGLTTCLNGPANEIIPKALTGMMTGILAGIAMFWVQKR